MNFDDDSEIFWFKVENQNQIITTTFLINFEDLAKIFLNESKFSFNCKLKNILQITFNFVFNKKHKNRKKHNLKSISSNKSKNFKLKNYTNFFCRTHLQKKMKLKICYDTKSKSSLISIKTVRDHYFTIKMHKIKNDQQIQCKKVDDQKKFDMYIEFSVRNKIINENFIIMKSEFHVISNLLCFLIMKTDFMKIYDIISKWDKKKKTNLVIIQNKYQIIVIVIKNTSAKSKKIKKTIFFWLLFYQSKSRSWINLNDVKSTCTLKKAES